MCDFRGDLESPALRLSRRGFLRTAGALAALAGLRESIALGERGWQQDDVLYQTDLEEVFRRSEARNVRLVGYTDVDGRPALKLGIQAVGER